MSFAASQDTYLRKAYAAGMPVKLIMTALSKTRGQVCKRAWDLGLTHPNAGARVKIARWSSKTEKAIARRERENARKVRWYHANSEYCRASKRKYYHEHKAGAPA